ncbi:SBBP repeat-containing protein [Methanothermobacter wolfeii]|uniref:SBBP repeat-containing protein n=1 Tax=Methanothermobacter wolfeii TaxID=145261 RepID=A0A9E7RWL6_METWO|nr:MULTISPECIES: SBBP repeat-containing protein [Methanothermobacter]MDI6701815.1 SBBP repeat-containing protein [Methanothermobacter wolfeii]UXH31799.1 SBBP repeat-containing protein [Methanothermobacter wolfeii]
MQLQPNQTTLDYSTYIGDNNLDKVKDIHIDYTGSAYITGSSLNGSRNVLLAKFDPQNKLVYSKTYNL